MLKIDTDVHPTEETQYLLEQMREQDIAYILDDLEGNSCFQAKASILLNEPRYLVIETPTPDIEIMLVCLPPASLIDIQPSGFIVTKAERMLRQVSFLPSAKGPLHWLVNNTEFDQTLRYEVIEPHYISGIDDRAHALFDLLRQHHDWHVQAFQQHMDFLPQPILDELITAMQLMENRLLNTVFKLLKANLYFDLLSHITPKTVAPNLYNWLVCPHDQSDQSRKLAALRHDAEFVSHIALGIPQRLNAIPHYRYGHPAHYLNHLLANDALSPKQAVEQVKQVMDESTWQLVRKVQEEQGVVAN